MKAVVPMRPPPSISGIPGLSVAAGRTEVPNVVADFVETPAEFLAVTVNPYEVQPSRVAMTQDPEAPITTHDCETVFPSVIDGEAVTKNDVGVPPDVPAATVTVTLPLPAMMEGLGGVPGATILATVNVNVAVPVCVPWVAVTWVAVTVHVPAAVAVSDVPDTRHTVPVVA